ncbi:MAG: chitobiase/beta-hexosaminidase C-terminal domain-containing protein [Oscillospiraceae bacterium]
MKKILSAFLALVMTFTVVCVGAEAAGYKLSASLSYGNGYTTVKLSGSGTIYYTTDGSKPTTKSTKYSGRIKITSPCKLRAAAYVNGERVKAIIKTVNVRVKSPTVKLSSQTETRVEYTVTKPSGARVYYTTDGSTPSENNGTKLNATLITVRENCTLKIVCVQSGWKNSQVKTIEVTGILTEEQYAEEVVRLVNIEREKYGLSPLRTNKKLMDTAQLRAQELTEYYDHTRPDGSRCFTALSQAGLNYRSAGENIAAGYSSPKAVVDGWMNSAGHRNNILSTQFTEIGVGYAASSNSSYHGYWAQMFIG